MELTIEQALQQGVAAHKEGKLQDAEKLYRAILQFEPSHPDANHNLGVLAVSVDKTDAALPFFKTALEANPKIEQFWLSYIDALIKEQQFENSKQVLEQGRKFGLVGDKVDAFEAQLKQITQSALPKSPEKKKSLTLKEKRKEVQLAPQDAVAHYNLGNTLKELQRLDEAEASYTKSIALKPDFAEAHCNLGSTLQRQGKFDQAEASYNQAIALKPDFAEAHCNLGNTLKELQRLDEAEASYTKSIALKPDFAIAYWNLHGIQKTIEKAEQWIDKCLISRMSN